MVFVESPWFSSWRDDRLNEEVFQALLNTLLADPKSGALISGGHGLRKLRLALPGRGKRGGADRIYLLFGYAKNVQADLTKDQIRRLAAAMQEDLNSG